MAKLIASNFASSVTLPKTSWPISGAKVIFTVAVSKSCHVDRYVGGRVNTRCRTTDLLAKRLGVNPIFGAAPLLKPIMSIVVPRCRIADHA